MKTKVQHGPLDFDQKSRRLKKTFNEGTCSIFSNGKTHRNDTRNAINAIKGQNVYKIKGNIFVLITAYQNDTHLVADLEENIYWKTLGFCCTKGKKINFYALLFKVHNKFFYSTIDGSLLYAAKQNVTDAAWKTTIFMKQGTVRCCQLATNSEMTIYKKYEHSKFITIKGQNHKFTNVSFFIKYHKFT